MRTRMVSFLSVGIFLGMWVLNTCSAAEAEQHGADEPVNNFQSISENLSRELESLKKKLGEDAEGGQLRENREADPIDPDTVPRELVFPGPIVGPVFGPTLETESPPGLSSEVQVLTFPGKLSQ